MQKKSQIRSGSAIEPSIYQKRPPYEVSLVRAALRRKESGNIHEEDGCSNKNDDASKTPIYEHIFLTKI